jgi:hypothetical protein
VLPLFAWEEDFLLRATWLVGAAALEVAVFEDEAGCCFFAPVLDMTLDLVSGGIECTTKEESSSALPLEEVGRI